MDPLGLFFYNPEDTPITIIPEDGPPTTVEPGGFYPDNIDGFKPPAYNGDWYKVPNFTTGSITPWGTPIEWGTGNLTPNFPDLGPLTDRLPGKKGPGFDDRWPDWKDPNECK